MTPLKDMYEQLAELQKKEVKTTEVVEEISRLQSDINLRERYLHRYIDHAPKAIDVLNQDIVDEFAGMENDEELKRLIVDHVTKTVHEWMKDGLVWGRNDANDLICYVVTKGMNWL